MQDPSFRYKRFLFFCFLGTFKPSSRQMRSTRLGFTIHPSALRRAVILLGAVLDNAEKCYKGTDEKESIKLVQAK